MVPADRPAEREAGVRLYAVAAQTYLVKSNIEMKIDRRPATLVLDRHRRVTERARRLRRVTRFHRVRIELLDRPFFMAKETGIASNPRLPPTNKAVIGAPVTGMGIQALNREVMASRADNRAILQRIRIIFWNRYRSRSHT